MPLNPRARRGPCFIFITSLLPHRFPFLSAPYALDCIRSIFRSPSSSPAAALEKMVMTLSKSVSLTVLKFTLTGALFVYLILHGHIAWSPLLTSLNEWQYSLPAFLILCLNPISQLIRWQKLLSARHLYLPYSEVFSYLMASKFLNMALPGYIGGDVLRGFYISRRASEHGVVPTGDAPSFPAATVVSSILFDRAAGLLTLFIFSLVGILGTLYHPMPGRLIVFAGFLASAGILGALFLFWIAYHRSAPPGVFLRIARKLRLQNIFSEFYDATHLYVRDLPLIRNILAISFVGQGIIMVSFILFGHALGLEVPLLSYLTLVPLGLMVTAIPISPAGLGVGHVAFLTLFQMGSSDQGANLFTLYMASHALINLTGAVLLPLFRGRAVLPVPASLAQVGKR
jgi:uncharacterized membrane protein YbhN (UPF0104 family)